MSYTIRSTPQFAAGQVVLTQHSASTRLNGLVEVAMEFACIGTQSALSRNMSLFLPGTSPPVALPEDLANAPLINGNVFLHEYTTRAQNGICYFSANYVGINSTVEGQSSESSTTKSALIATRKRVVLPGGSTGFIFVQLSFDYLAVEARIQYCSFDLKNRKTVGGRIEQIRNIKRYAGGTQAMQAQAATISPYTLPRQDVLAMSFEKIGPVYVITESSSPEFGGGSDSGVGGQIV
jgi:hypothetical protein